MRLVVVWVLGLIVWLVTLLKGHSYFVVLLNTRVMGMCWYIHNLFSTSRLST